MNDDDMVYSRDLGGCCMVALLFAFQKLVGKNISVALVELLRNHERLRLKRSTIRVMILPHKESALSMKHL